MSELHSELVVLLGGDRRYVLERHQEHAREDVDSLIYEVAELQRRDIVIVLVIQDHSPSFWLTPRWLQLTTDQENGQMRGARGLRKELMELSAAAKQTVLSLRALTASWTGRVARETRSTRNILP